MCGSAVWCQLLRQSPLAAQHESLSTGSAREIKKHRSFGKKIVLTPTLGDAPPEITRCVVVSSKASRKHVVRETVHQPEPFTSSQKPQTETL